MTAGCGLRDAVSPSDAVSRPASSEAVPATGVSEAVDAKDSAIPQARNGARVNIRFAASEGVPEELTVTQQGNTVQANTGIPYDIRENELTRDEDGYYFDIDFGTFTMYYYVAACRWSNGNTAEYAFALERSAA